MSTIREDRLQERVYEALGIETFNPEIFLEKVDHITVTGNGTLTIFMKDGTSRDMTFSTKRKMPGWTQERREKFAAQPKREVSEETRQKMSERMKQLRKERGKNWRKT